MLYKLTERDGTTYGGTHWDPGVTHKAPGVGPLYTEGWVHAYTDPWIALLMNAVHGRFKSPRLWEGTSRSRKRLDDHGLEIGVTSLTLHCELVVPELLLEKIVEWAIRCSLECKQSEEYVQWAEGWLSGKDRSRRPAWAARWGADSVAGAAEWSAAQAMQWAGAAQAAEWAARSAQLSAQATESPIDFAGIARQVFGEFPREEVVP